jgi:hypothetical protein
MRVFPNGDTAPIWPGCLFRATAGVIISIIKSLRITSQVCRYVARVAALCPCFDFIITRRRRSHERATYALDDA